MGRRTTTTATRKKKEEDERKRDVRMTSTGTFSLHRVNFKVVLLLSRPRESKTGAGINEADDRQVTTVFTVQPSFHHQRSTNRVSLSVIIVGERAVSPHLVVRRRW